ncbi:MAG: TolC family protein [Thermoanaerobaculia bacterium]|nr:TolC family protein [Thermoanaerobaculia bacterium]
MRLPSPGVRPLRVPLLFSLLTLLSTNIARAEDTPLTIGEAIRLAVTRNERALASGERLEAAEARVSKARAVFFPDVEASGAWTHRPFERTTTVGGEEVVVSKYDAFSTTLSARQVLFDARAFPVLRQTRSERDAARFEAAEQRRIVAFEASAAFLMTLGYEQVAAAADRRVELARQTLSDARARFEAQISGSNDVTRAELEVASAEREATRAHNQEETSRLALANLLVAPVPARLEVPVELLAPPSDLGAGEGDLVERARQLRFDVAAQKKRAEAFLYFSKEPASRFLPSLVGRADGRWTNEPGLSGRSTTWTYGVDLSWSLFDSTISFAETRERKALARASALEAEALERGVELDVKTALANLANARAAVAQAGVALEAARKNASETTTLYREGLANALSAADANQSLFEADVARTRELYTLGAAVLDLYAAQGLDPDGKEPLP